MEYLEGIMIGGIAIAPLVVALVALAKKIGLPDEYAPYANGGLAVVLWLVATQVVGMNPVVDEVVKVVAAAVVIFLSASGVHQFGKIHKK